MYYIVERFRNWSYRKPFNNFLQAYWIQQLINPDAEIVYFDGYNEELMWSPDWEGGCVCL